jgi:hypothetical protein
MGAIDDELSKMSADAIFAQFSERDPMMATLGKLPPDKAIKLLAIVMLEDDFLDGAADGGAPMPAALDGMKILHYAKRAFMAEAGCEMAAEEEEHMTRMFAELDMMRAAGK